jgi:dUTP pyrophosphatase
MKVKIKKLNDKAVMPQWNNRSAGCDLSSTEDYTLKPGERKLFKTGISVAIPSGFYGRVAPRSGLAYKNGLDVLAGVIDEDYRGDVGVILINLGQEDKGIVAGDKIAQLIFEVCARAEFVEVENLDETDRGAGGYGSTDKKVQNELLDTFKQVQSERKFTLGRQTTIDRIVVKDKHEADSIRSYLGNFQGEIYEYTENGKKGLCIVDSAGTIQVKYQL